MLSDISDMSMSNNYNSMINEENMKSIADAKELTSMKQQAANAQALSNQQSDNVKDYVSDGRDVFSGIMAGKYVNDEVMKGIYKAGGNDFNTEGVKAYAKNEVGKLFKQKTGKSLDEVSKTLSNAKAQITNTLAPDAPNEVSGFSTSDNEARETNPRTDGDDTRTVEPEPKTPLSTDTRGSPVMKESNPLFDENGKLINAANYKAPSLTQPKPVETEPDMFEGSVVSNSAPKSSNLFEDNGPSIFDEVDKGTVLNRYSNLLLGNTHIDPNLDTHQEFAINKASDLMNPGEFQKVLDANPGKTVVRRETENGFVEDRVYAGKVDQDGSSILSGYETVGDTDTKPLGIVQQRIQNIEGKSPVENMGSGQNFQDQPKLSNKPDINNEGIPDVNESFENAEEADVGSGQDFTNRPKLETPAQPSGDGIPDNIGSFGDEAKTLATDATKSSNYLGVGMKIAGAVPGVIDAFSDLTHTNSKGNWDPQLAGDNNYEKASNALAIGSTVLDFVPGLEWAGAIGNLASAGIGIIGDTKDQTNLKISDASSVVSAIKPDIQSSLNYHALGMVSNISNNSLDLIHGSSSF